MNYSKIALKILAAKECGIVKTNAQFHKTFKNKQEFEKIIQNNTELHRKMDILEEEFKNNPNNNRGFICLYDDDFPVINKEVKNNSEKPYLLFYEGDISLLKNLNNNVAVIGLTEPTKEIIEREKNIVQELLKENLVIVSGLAKGCDTIAHQECLNQDKETIAILSTHLDEIYPVENTKLSENIINKNGLLLTEYYKKARSSFEAIGRLVERDRLQAMFSKAIILIASYRKDEGDSGSRHAMQSAKKYNIERYVLYNSKTDSIDKMFGLNKNLIESDSIDKAKVLNKTSIEEIRVIKNVNLMKKPVIKVKEQISLF